MSVFYQESLGNGRAAHLQSEFYKLSIVLIFITPFNLSHSKSIESWLYIDLSDKLALVLEECRQCCVHFFQGSSEGSWPSDSLPTDFAESVDDNMAMKFAFCTAGI